MKRSLFITFGAVAVAAVVALHSHRAAAQTVSTFLGGSGTTELAQTGWTTAGNWNTSTVPTGTGVWPQINSSTATALRVNYGSSAVGTTGTLTVGAISFLPTLTVATGSTYEFRNSSSSQRGTLRFYGVDTTVGGVPRRVILDNRTALGDIGVSQSSQGQDYELYTSGAINVAASTSLTLSPLIRDGSGSRSITKVGQGVLSFAGVGYAATTTNNSGSSTYSGGFVMDGGIVQWALSGTAGVGTPFGLGALTLRSGTLRSTTTSGRSINSSVILDGFATLGSVDSGFTGSITINSSGGALTTTVASDSILTVVAGGSTAWNQGTSGTGSLTKAGAGILRFTGAGGALTHTGSTVVQSGTLIMAANLSSSSPVSVLNAATLLGTGTVAGAALIQAGGVFSPGAVSGTAGVFTFGSGGLGLAGQTILELSGTSRGTSYDGVNMAGALTYGGSLLLQFSGTLPEGTYNLFSGFASQVGSFASISAAGGYSGSLTEASGVWSGTFGPQTLTFTNATGDLVIVPEPSLLLAAGGSLAIAIGGVVRRLRGPRRAS
ncbi:MAG: beta strand repeat-containing protein [Planctomycetaceae bacterium]